MKYILVVILNFGATICLAQKNFQKGQILTNNGNIVAGYINYQEKIKNPVSIEFKKNIDDKESNIYTVGELKSFEISGLEYYTRYACNISMDYRDINNLTIGKDTSNITDTVFLRSRVSGKYVELLTYQDKIKFRFFLKSIKDSFPKELVYKAYLDANAEMDVIKEVNDFRYQFILYAGQFNAASEIFKKLSSVAGYNLEDLGKLTRLINNDVENNKIGKSGATGNKKWFRFLAGAGLSRANMRYSGENANNLKFSFPDSYSPVISVGMDFIFKPAIGRFLIRQEFSFFKGSYKGAATNNVPSTYYFHSYFFRQNVFYSSTSLLYNLYNKDAIKFFLAGGVNLYYMGYPENIHYIKTVNETRQTDPFLFYKSVIGGSFRAGVTLKKRIVFTFIHESPINLTPYLKFKYTTSSQQLRVSYLFLQ